MALGYGMLKDDMNIAVKTEHSHTCHLVKTRYKHNRRGQVQEMP